jgi:tetratricopeptide (TPR) repeat protein
MRLEHSQPENNRLVFRIAALLLVLGLGPSAAPRAFDSADTPAGELELRVHTQREAVRSENPAQIIEASQQVIALALRQLGEWRSRETAYFQAIALYRSSLQVEDSAQTRQLLAEAESHAGERVQIFAQDDVDPAARLDKSVLAKSKLTPAQIQRGNVREKRLRRILGIGYNDWGTSEARQQQYQKAISHFHEGERWDPSTPDLMRNLGMAAAKIGDHREAVRALKVAVNQAPGDQALRSLLAISLFSVGQFADAAASFKMLGETNFADPNLAYAWAYSLSRSDQLKQSASVLAKLTTQPLSAEMLVLVGHLYTELGDYNHALDSFRKATQQDPSIKKGHDGAGVALIRMDRPAEAVPELEAELKLNPDDSDAQFQLAYALLQLSKKEQAVELLRSLVAAHPDHAAAHYELGKEMLAAGQTDDAVRDLEVAAKLEPDHAYVHYQLQAAYRRAGKTTEAERELKIYRELKDRDRQRISNQGAHEGKPPE